MITNRSRTSRARRPISIQRVRPDCQREWLGPYRPRHVGSRFLAGPNVDGGLVDTTLGLLDLDPKSRGLTSLPTG